MQKRRKQKLKKNLMSKIIIVIVSFIIAGGSAVFAEDTNSKDINKKQEETNKKKSSKKHNKKRIDIEENQGQLTLITEKIVYTLLKDRPITLRQKGPKEIYITTYLDFKKDMIGIKKYTIIVIDEHKNETRYNFTTEKSITMTYKEKTDVVPGRPKSFLVKIPKGYHEYNFILTNTEADSGSVYFYYYKDNIKKRLKQ